MEPDGNTIDSSTTHAIEADGRCLQAAKLDKLRARGLATTRHCGSKTKKLEID